LSEGERVSVSRNLWAYNK